MNKKRVIITVFVIVFIIYISNMVNNHAVNFMSGQLERKNGIIIEAEPYKIERNPDTTVLLVHGITSSPKDFRNMADYLASKNISVNAILLPGHGTYPKDLQKTRYQDWILAVSEEFDKINSKNKFILGYSLGGALTLDVAESKELNGIVVINAPIYLHSKYLPFIPLVKLVQDYHVKQPESIMLAINEDRVMYDAMPLDAASELVKLIEQLKPMRITAPALIIQTNNDTIVKPESADFIYNSMSSEDKKLIWLESSSHEEPQEQEQEEIFEEIYSFIKSNSK